MPPPTGVTPAPKFLLEFASEVVAEHNANRSRGFGVVLPREPIPCGLHTGDPISQTVGAENTIGNAGRPYWVCSGGCFLGWGDRDQKNPALSNVFREKRRWGGVVRQEWINDWESTEAWEQEKMENMIAEAEEEMWQLRP